MLNSRRIIAISKVIDSRDPQRAPICEETAAQARIDRLLRDVRDSHHDLGSIARASRIIQACESETPLHLRSNRFAAGPFIAIAAALVIASGITVIYPSTTDAEKSAAGTSGLSMNAVTSPFATEARLIVDDTARAADAVFAHLPRMRE